MKMKVCRKNTNLSGPGSKPVNNCWYTFLLKHSLSHTRTKNKSLVSENQKIIMVTP